MHIEAKLALQNLKRNRKRTIFTTLSITLCSVLLLITILCISSIKNGITQTIDTGYPEYHFSIKNLTKEQLDSIKEKPYIDAIYIQENIDTPLEPADTFFPSNTTRNVYILYTNARNVSTYSNDIIQTLNLPDKEKDTDISRYDFNQKLLTMQGLIDVWIDNTNTCKVRVNYSYILDIFIVVLLGVFSILFIIILYNAFLISINERKKEYAVLNSIGGTEGQIVKMVFLEALIMGIVGIVVGGLISIIGTNYILQSFNTLLSSLGYCFNLVVDIPYILVAILLILLNLYVSVLIPSVKASNTSVIQGIRNTKQIRYKKGASLLEKILPIEGSLAIQNMKRNKNKYRVITILLVVCMTSYITVSTYIAYETQTAELVQEYDADATLMIEPSCNIDYMSLLHHYETQSGTSLKTVEYKMTGLSFLVEPEDALIDNNGKTFEDGKRGLDMIVVGLEDTAYAQYIQKIKADDGQWIFYNMHRSIVDFESYQYIERPIFQTTDNVKLSLLARHFNEEKDLYEYELIDGKSWEGNFVSTNEFIDGFSELKTKYFANALFVPMDAYIDITHNLPQNAKTIFAAPIDTTYVKIDCENAISLSNYLDDFIKKHELDTMNAQYHSLENQEKILYIKSVQFLLILFILAVILVGIMSTTNIINASLAERTQEFTTLYTIGATKGNIRKVLIHECMYIFFKATILSIILSIPIVYGIIKYMENILVLHTLYIPFGNISIFFALLLCIAFILTLCSTKSIKDL